MGVFSSNRYFVGLTPLYWPWSFLLVWSDVTTSPAADGTPYEK
jgi:hypothetical protein